MRLRLRRGAGRGSALEPARLLAAGARARRASFSRAPGETTMQGEGLERDAFPLLADALWYATRAGPADGLRLREEAFAAMQDAMAGAANRAIEQMAVRRYADGAREGLGALVRERTSLDDQLSENMNRLSRSFASASPNMAREREQLVRDRERIEARGRAIDARLRDEFPDYFSLIRPAPLAIPDAQRLLRPDEAILLIVPSPFGFHVVVVTGDRFEWHRSNLSPSELDFAVQRLRWMREPRRMSPRRRAVNGKPRRRRGVRAGASIEPRLICSTDCSSSRSRPSWRESGGSTWLGAVCSPGCRFPS